MGDHRNHRVVHLEFSLLRVFWSFLTDLRDSGLPSPAPLPVSKNKRVHGSLHRDGDTTGRAGPCVRPLLPPWDLTCTRRNPSSCAETDDPFEARRLRRPLQHRRGVAPANHVPSVGPGRKYDPGRRVTGARPGPPLGVSDWDSLYLTRRKSRGRTW